MRRFVEGRAGDVKAAGVGYSDATAEDDMTGIIVTLLVLFTADPALAHHAMDGATPTTFWHGLLSGLGHPVIGLDHLAAVIAVGCLAAGQRRGVLLAIGYVAAMVVGAAAHIGEAAVAGAELMVALSVVALGLVLLRSRSIRPSRAKNPWACARRPASLCSSKWGASARTCSAVCRMTRRSPRTPRC